MLRNLRARDFGRCTARESLNQEQYKETLKNLHDHFLGNVSTISIHVRGMCTVVTLRFKLFQFLLIMTHMTAYDRVFGNST